MARGCRRKCKCCRELFRPDPCNRRQQHRRSRWHACFSCDKTSARFSIYLAKHQRTEMPPSNRGDGKEARCPLQMQLPTSALFLGQLSGVGRCVAS